MSEAGALEIIVPTEWIKIKSNWIKFYAFKTSYTH